MDDWQLVEQIRRARDEPAFAELVRRHAGLVHATCRRRLRCDVRVLRQVEDVVQAVFLLLWQRPPTQRAGAALSGWLYQTTVYACNNAMRSERIRQQHERQAANEAAMRQDAAATGKPSLQPEFELHLDAALGALPRKDRDVVLLRFYEDRDVSDVGKVLGISQNTAAKRLSRAVARLKQLLVDRGAGMDLSLAIPAALLQFGQIGGAGSTTEVAARVVSSVCGSAASGGGETSFLTKQIADGVIQMIRQSQLKIAAMIALPFSLMLGAGLFTLTVLRAGEPSSPPAAMTASQKLEAATPIDTLRTFAKAIRAADVEKMRALVKIEEPIEQELLDAACDYSKASLALNVAMKEKFGAEPVAKFAAQMREFTPLDVFASIIEKGMEKAAVTQDGQFATVTPEGQPENALHLVRDGDIWKISAAKNIEKWPDQMRIERRDMMRRVCEAMEQLTDEVKSGKLASIQDVGQALAEMMGRGR